MENLIKLPDAEFEVMQAVWGAEPPLNANDIMASLGTAKRWRVQTAISLLNRLVEREYLRTEKLGKERVYYPLVCREDYLRYETRNFLQMYHRNSLASLVSALSGNESLSEDDILELTAWLRERGE